MQFKVSRIYKETVSRQLNMFRDDGLISKEQCDEMKGAYVIEKTVGVTRLVSVVGSVLIGLGILTYIAGNWQYMSPMFRMMLIVVGMTAFYVTGMMLDDNYPKTARALRYIALFIYGGGLFLTDQTFHLNRSVSWHFLIWAVGILTVLYFGKDKLLLYFFQALIIASIMGLGDSRNMTEFAFYAYWFVSTVGVVFAIRLSEESYRSGLAVFLNILGLFTLIIVMLAHIELEFVLGTGLILLFGLLLLFKPPFGTYALEVVKQSGLIITGFSGFVLTFADPWSDLMNGDGTSVSIVFTIILLLGLFYLVKSGYVGAVAFIALVILRYYFDTFYDFMPKSMFFIIGGIILLGFGVYLESVRRKGMKLDA